MRNQHRIGSRGEFSFSSLFFFVVFVLGGWFAIKFAGAYFDKSKIEAAMTSRILASKTEGDDLVIAEKLVADIQSLTGLSLNPKDVVVYRTADRSRMRLDFSYKVPVYFPGINFGWDLEMDCSVADGFKSRRSRISNRGPPLFQKLGSCQSLGRLTQCAKIR